jgi:membrane protein DedA with SNARE-associated domain
VTRRRGLLVTGLVAIVILLIALLEGDFDLLDLVGDLGVLAKQAVSSLGAPGAVALLYVEESGVPLPIPGDVWVVYLGTLAPGSLPSLLAAWVACVVAVVGGASNLYLLSRRYGRRILEHRLARFLHLDADRLAQVEHWLRRYGVVTVVFGRHVPGFRIPITVMSGIFQLPYRVFAPSVAVSSAIWAGIWLVLAYRYGKAALHLVTGNPNVYIAIAIAVAVVAAFVGVRIWVRAAQSQSDSGPSADGPELPVPEDERVAGP